MSKNIDITPIDNKLEPHGYWEVYWLNCKLMYKGNFYNGNQHGYWETYCSNGTLNYKGNYLNGQKHGYWESYCSNGEVFYKGYYDDGKKVDYEVNIDSSPKDMFPIY